MFTPRSATTGDASNSDFGTSSSPDSIQRVTYWRIATSQTMSFGQAWDGAEAIVTLLGLLTVTPILLAMTQNLGNPEFDMMAAAKAGIYGTVEALAVPSLVLTFVIAILLYLLMVGRNSR